MWTSKNSTRQTMLLLPAWDVYIPHLHPRLDHSIALWMQWTLSCQYLFRVSRLQWPYHRVLVADSKYQRTTVRFMPYVCVRMREKEKGERDEKRETSITASEFSDMHKPNTRKRTRYHELSWSSTCLFLPLFVFWIRVLWWVNCTWKWI